MAKVNKEAEARQEEVREDQRQTYTVARPTLITGQWFRPGDDVELYPSEARYYVQEGYIEGDRVHDAFGPGERAVGAPNVLKNPEDRDDMEVLESTDEYFAKHDIGQGASGQTFDEEGNVQEAEGSSRSEDRSGEGYAV